jgi:hypothetical protein
MLGKLQASLTVPAVAGPLLNEVLGHAAQGPKERRGPGQLECHKQMPAPLPGPEAALGAVERGESGSGRRCWRPKDGAAPLCPAQAARGNRSAPRRAACGEPC